SGGGLFIDFQIALVMNMTPMFLGLVSGISTSIVKPMPSLCPYTTSSIVRRFTDDSHLSSCAAATPQIQSASDSAAQTLLNFITSIPPIKNVRSPSPRGKWKMFVVLRPGRRTTNVVGYEVLTD